MLPFVRHTALLLVVMFSCLSMICKGFDEEKVSHIYKNLLKNDNFDLDHVTREYSKVCPYQRMCNNVATNWSFFYTLTEYDNLFLPINCPNCSCEQDCIINDECCPSVIFGYLKYECVSSMIRYGESIIDESFFMIGSCPQPLIDENEFSNQNESIRPVTSFTTGMTYKTEEFANCNGDNLSLAVWNTTFSCEETKFGLEIEINTLDDLVLYLNERKCVIKLSVTNPFVPDQIVCNGLEYLKKKKFFKERERVDKCNITGLWEKFDPHIDFACRHLSLPFGDYKSVFCYICNPGLSVRYHVNKPTISTCQRDDSDANIINACLKNEQTTYYLPYKNVFCLLCNIIPRPYVSVSVGLQETWILVKDIDENIVAKAIGQFFQTVSSCENMTFAGEDSFYRTSLKETISLDFFEYSCTIPLYITRSHTKSDNEMQECERDNNRNETNIIDSPAYNCSDSLEMLQIQKVNANSSFAKEELLMSYILYIYLCDDSVKFNNVCESHSTLQINSFPISTFNTDKSLPCFICDTGDAYRQSFSDKRTSGFDILIKTVCPTYLHAEFFLDTLSFLEAIREDDCSIWFFPTGVLYRYFYNILTETDDCIDFPWIDQFTCRNTQGSFFFGSYRKLFSIPNSNSDWEEVLQFSRRQSSNVSHHCTQSDELPIINTNDICREILCSDGHVLVKDVCKNEVETSLNVQYHLKFHLEVSDLQKRTVLVADANTNQTFEDNYDVIGIVYICDSVKAVIQQQLNESVSFSFTECIVSTYSICPLTKIVELVIGTNIEISIKVIIHFTKALTLVEANLIMSLENAPGTYFVSPSGIKLSHLRGKPVADLQQCFVLNYNTDIGFIAKEYLLSKLLTCPQVALFENEYILDNVTNTLLLLKTKKKIENYNIVNGSVRICLDDFKSNIRKDPQVSILQRIYKIVDNVCTILSLVAISLAFITYLLFPPLRTVPGVNNMSLMFSLFFAQITLKFGIWQPTDMTICPVIGIMIHYFWLATFCSMNICSFHMYRVFSSKSASFILVSRNTNVSYLLYTYLLPTSIIIITMCIHLVLSAGESFGYGRTICFLTHHITIIASFLCPCVFVFLLNVFFFFKTFLSMRRTTSDPILRRSQEKRHVFVYLRLSTLLGITWPLLIVDAFFMMSVFSFIALIFNTLQGLFVFISFVCNKRVLNMYHSFIFGKTTESNVKSTSQENRS